MRHQLRLRHGLLLLVAGAAFFMAACRGSGTYVRAESYQPAAAPIHPEVIRPGDVVSVRVFGQEPMSVRARVRSDGLVAIPLLGEQQLAGKLPSAAARELEQLLKPFVAEPHVIVVIEESTVQVTVLGEVRETGRFALPPPARLIDAMAEAGGLTEFADETAVYVLRDGQRIRFDYVDILRGAQHVQRFKLQSGDVVVAE